MRLHLVDGTYELFRSHYSRRPPREAPDGRDVKATVGVLDALLALLEDDDEQVTHLVRVVGAEVGAVDLTVTADGWLIAATEAGLQQSGDGGATFEVIGSTPLLYQLATTPDGVIVGVDIAGVLWRSADAVNWESFGTATGGVQALGVSADGAVVLIDDRGLIWIDDSIETIIPLG